MNQRRLLLFIDSNVVFSASRTDASPFLRFWSNPAWELLTSPHSIGEIRRNCETPVQAERAEILLKKLRVIPDRPDLALPSEIILPAKDVPIYLAALGAGATFLITGDKKHFGPYFHLNILGMTVIEPMPFLRLQDR